MWHALWVNAVNNNNHIPYQVRNLAKTGLSDVSTDIIFLQFFPHQLSHVVLMKVHEENSPHPFGMVDKSGPVKLTLKLQALQNIRQFQEPALILRTVRSGKLLYGIKRIPDYYLIACSLHTSNPCIQ